MDRPALRHLHAAEECDDFGVVPQADDQIMSQKSPLKTEFYGAVLHHGNVHLKDIQRRIIPFWNEVSASFEITFGANQP